MKVKIKNKEFYIDEYLKSNLDHAKKSVDANWDCIFVIDGMEGSAKSTIGKMISYYLSDGNFSEKNIVFTVKQFEEAIDKAKPNTAILWDEFVLAGTSEDALTKMQKALVKKFTLIRKKKLFIGLVIPYIFMLKKYFGISRSKFLIHVYSPDMLKRGYFKFYNYSQKNYLYNKGRKYWIYPKDCDYSFHGRFTDYTGFFINEESYETKKDEAMKETNTRDEEKKIIPTKKMAEAIINANFSQLYDHDSSPRRLLSEYQKRLREYFREKGKSVS